MREKASSRASVQETVTIPRPVSSLLKPVSDLRKVDYRSTQRPKSGPALFKGCVQHVPRSLSGKNLFFTGPAFYMAQPRPTCVVSGFPGFNGRVRLRPRPRPCVATGFAGINCRVRHCPLPATICGPRRMPPGPAQGRAPRRWRERSYGYKPKARKGKAP